MENQCSSFQSEVRRALRNRLEKLERAGCWNTPLSLLSGRKRHSHTCSCWGAAKEQGFAGGTGGTHRGDERRKPGAQSASVLWLLRQPPHVGRRHGSFHCRWRI